MAKDGFKLLDSDMHIVEPPDLWKELRGAAESSLEPETPGRAAQRGVRS
jgi:hypothetical protein